MQEYKESGYDYIKLIIKWKSHFITITIASIIIAVVFSSDFFIKPKYKSTAIVYPSNLISYSSESPSEQMLQLLKSSDIRNAVTQKFNLAAHYDIDTTEKNGHSNLIAMYESNVEVDRTQFESIEIDVLDTDPVLAKNMVIEIIKELNLKARNLQRKKTAEVVVIVKNQLILKRKQIDSLGVILQEFREKYQLLDYEIQTKEVTKSYLKALSGGVRKENIKDITGLMKNLEEKGGEFYQIQKSYNAILKSYNETKLEYDKALKDLNKELTYTNIVTEPAVADKKSYPIRWLIVLASVASANMFLFLTLLLGDFKKRII